MDSFFEPPAAQKLVGYVRLWYSGEDDVKEYKFGVSPEDADSEWLASFKSLACRGGSHLPLSVQDQLSWCKPRTPLTWWLAFVWRYANKVPAPLGPWGGWSTPFQMSALAIQRCELLSTTGGRARDGEWSEPLSKAEIACRLTGKKKAKARDIPNDFLQKYVGLLERFSPNKWLVRLDKLPDEIKKKFT